MILYHITQKRYLKSILKRGLLCNMRHSDLYFCGNIKQAKFWIDDFKDTYLLKNKMAILKCKVDKFKIIHKINNEIIEAVSDKNIFAKNIKIIYTE